MMVQAMRTKSKGVMRWANSSKSHSAKMPFLHYNSSRRRPNLRKFMHTLSRRIALVLPLTLLLQAGGWYVHAADITVVSVLEIARDEAEKGDARDRVALRHLIAGAMHRTGQEQFFGRYVEAAIAAYEMPSPHRPKDETDEHNVRVEREAKRAFLAGDISGATRALEECKFTIPPPPCSQGEWPLGPGVFLELKFLRWEIDAGRFQSALARLRDAPWPPDLWQLLLLNGGANVAAGDPDRMQEIARLIRKSGIVVTSCVADPTSLFLYSDIKSKPLSNVARVRQLACDGQPALAIEKARAEDHIFTRVKAFGAIAEGLLGIAGLPDE